MEAILAVDLPRTSTETAALMARLRNGDPDALSEIYRRTQPNLYRFALAMTGSPAVAEEALQETYLRLIQAPAQFDPHRGHLLAFLFGVLRNVISGLHRQGRRFSALDPGTHDSVASAEDPAHAAIEQSERADQLWAAIGTLPEHYREVLVLCDLEELDYEQAARLLARPVGTIRSRLNRARSLLKWKLAPERGTQPERGSQQ